MRKMSTRTNVAITTSIAAIIIFFLSAGLPGIACASQENQNDSLIASSEQIAENASRELSDIHTGTTQINGENNNKILTKAIEATEKTCNTAYADVTSYIIEKGVENGIISRASADDINGTYRSMLNNASSDKQRETINDAYQSIGKLVKKQINNKEKLEKSTPASALKLFMPGTDGIAPCSIDETLEPQFE